MQVSPDQADELRKKLVQSKGSIKSLLEGLDESYIRNRFNLSEETQVSVSSGASDDKADDKKEGDE